MPPFFADADEGAFGDECLSKVDAAGSVVDGPDEAGVGVDAGDERSGDVRGVMKDANPKFGRE